MSDAPARTRPDPATDLTARWASRLLLAGAALLVIGNSSHPADSAPSALSRLELATSPTWVVIHLAIALGVLLVVAGLVGLQRLITTPAAEPFARLGSAMAMVGGTVLAVVFAGLDGYGQYHLAEDWETADAAQRNVLEGAATALEAADSGLAALGVLTLFGLAMVAYGRAILAGRLVRPALGWVAVVLGTVGLVTGVTFAIEGPTSLVINSLFRPLAMGTTLWFAALGVAVRKASPRTSDPAPIGPVVQSGVQSGAVPA